MEDDVWWSAGWRAQQGCDVLFVSAELRVPNITFLNFRRLHVQSQHNCGHIFRSDCCFLQSFVGLSGNNHWVITEPTICLYNAKWPLVYYARNMRLMFWYTKSYSPGGGGQYGHGGTMNHKLYHHHHLPASAQQLLLSNSISKSKWGGDPTVCWQLAVYVRVRHCVRLLLAGAHHCLLKSALYGQIKSPSL